MYESEYLAKLTTAEQAVKLIPARGTLSMGMAASEPPALLGALENRVKAGTIEELRVYYSHSMRTAADTSTSTWTRSNRIHSSSFRNRARRSGGLDQRVSGSKPGRGGQCRDGGRPAIQRAGRSARLRTRRAALQGRQSILTAHSTAAKGAVSRIVARLEGPATDPRADSEYIVTEYGVANLRGKSTTQRSEELIAIAHPDFRGELYRQARELGYL